MTDATTYSSKLVNTRVLVVGGSSGIGFGLVSALIEQGAGSIIISSSSQQRIENAIERVRKAYPNRSKQVDLSGHAANLKDQANLEKTVEGLLDFATANKSKKLDHIVYTAGDHLAAGHKLDEMTLKDINDAGAVRFYAPTLLSMRAPAYMNPGPKSSITLTSGSAGQKPIPGWAVIGAFASALKGLMQGLAIDLAPIRVNLVSPGPIVTEIWDTLSKSDRDEFTKLADRLPPKRLGAPEDIAEAYLFSLRDINLTGTLLNSNGGLLLI